MRKFHSSGSLETVRGKVPPADGDQRKVNVMRIPRVLSHRVVVIGVALTTTAALGAGADHLVGAGSAAASGGAQVVVQTMDLCKTGIGGAAYTLEGVNGTFTAGTKGSPLPLQRVSSSPTCPLQQGNCSTITSGCLTFSGIPAGDYRLIETAGPTGDCNPAGYAPCEGGSACRWETADVTVDANGGVVAKVVNAYPDGTLVTWPSTTGSSVYHATASDPIVFHDFGLAPPGTAGDQQCDGDSDADDWSTGTPSQECNVPELQELNVCPGSPAPHFPWDCMTDPDPVIHVSASGAETATSFVPGRPGTVTPATDDTFVANLYHDVLGRSALPSQSEISYWATQLADGASRAQVAQAFVGSDEAHSDAVDADYQLLLGRASDPTGNRYWTTRLDSGAYNETIEGTIAASPEYYAKHGRGTDAGFVTALYRDFLGRTPSGAEVASWMPGGHVADRGLLAMTFAFTHEHHLDIVESWYQRFLRRAGDPAGLAYWTAYLDAGNRDDAGDGEHPLVGRVLRPADGLLTHAAPSGAGGGANLPPPARLRG